jgi:rubrerythrin
MNYSQEIGQTLAETLTELFAIDDIPLNEIRDLKTLQGHMDTAKEKYGEKHPRYQALQNLHAKKTATEARKTERMGRIKTRQEFHAKRYGYTPVKGSKRNQWVHAGTGHTLNFGGGRSWSHMKAGGKRAKGGNATPIRALRQHLAKLHEEIDSQGEQLQEIRHYNVLGKLASQALLASDPRKRQELQRILSLRKRKMNLRSEAESAGGKAIAREKAARQAAGRPPMDSDDVNLILRSYSPVEKERHEFLKKVYAPVKEEVGRHKTTKKADDPTFSKEWSGVSRAPHCGGSGCPTCGTKMHHEGGSHYCPSCDDYKHKPQNCKYM